MVQEEGLIGALVGGMIRRSVRKRFHTVWYQPPATQIQAPAILYANHNGWMDGYLMFNLVNKLELRSLDWVTEFDAFPLFGKVGCMPFPKDRFEDRVKTIRQTVKLMRSEKRSLVIFPEQELHRPGPLLPFGGALKLVAEKVPNVTMVPTAIHYELSMHERPEAWVSFGEAHSFASLVDCQERLWSELGHLRQRIGNQDGFNVLVDGTKDVNERMSMKKVIRRD